jgi:hypothetical protein
MRCSCGSRASPVKRASRVGAPDATIAVLEPQIRQEFRAIARRRIDAGGGRDASFAAVVRALELPLT